MSEEQGPIKQPVDIAATKPTAAKWILIGCVLFCIGFISVACGFSLPGQTPEAETQPISLATYEAGDLTTTDSPTNTNQIDGSDMGMWSADTIESAENRDSDLAAATTGVDDNVDISAADNRTSSVEQPADRRSNALGRYNGEIEPDDTVVIAAEINGAILNVFVDVGDVVQAGQVLVEIDSAVLQGQQAQAIAGLKAAQAQLDQLLGDADPEDLDAARAAVNAAASAYNEVTNGPRNEDLRIAEANLRQSEAAVQRAQNAYNLVKWRNDIGALPQSENLRVATLSLEAAQAQYEKIVEGATSDVIAGAYAQLVQARTQLTNLQNGAAAEQIMAAEAQVEQAEAALYLASVQLAKTTIRAPMDGIVMSKNVAGGAIAAPGAPLLTLMSRAMNVVIPVEELQLGLVVDGQPATILVNAYPDQTFDGEVLRVAPRLDAATRTVEVTIRPSGLHAAQLRPGMFATVELLAASEKSADGPTESTNETLAALQ